MPGGPERGRQRPELTIKARGARVSPAGRAPGARCRRPVRSTGAHLVSAGLGAHYFFCSVAFAAAQPNWPFLCYFTLKFGFFLSFRGLFLVPFLANWLGFEPIYSAKMCAALRDIVTADLIAAGWRIGIFRQIAVFFANLGERFAKWAVGGDIIAESLQNGYYVAMNDKQNDDFNA